MNTKQNTEDPMMAAIDRICASLDGAGVAGKGTSAALREMSSHWTANGGNVNPATATADIETAMALFEKVRKALFKQTESSGPIKLVSTKLAQSKILSESASLPLGSIRVSDMNFNIPRMPETDKIMMSILKGSPGKFKQAAMEIMEGRAGLIAWYEKSIGPIEKGTTMPIQELLEAVAAAMYHQATSS